MENKESLKHLKTFFNVSTASFSSIKEVLALTGGRLPDKTKAMYDLHLEAKAELEKDEPDIDRVLFIMQQCEILAATPEMPKNLVSGGISKRQVC